MQNTHKLLFGNNLQRMRGGGKPALYLFLFVFLVMGNFSVQAQVFPDANGQVTQILPDGSGGFFICGSFSVLTEKPAGVPVNRAGIAHIFADGRVDRAWNANVEEFGRSPSNMVILGPGLVRACALENGKLYISGFFSVVGGQARAGVAAVNASDGGLLPWNPNPNVPVNYNPFSDIFWGREWGIAATPNYVFVGGRRPGTLYPVRKMGILSTTTGEALQVLDAATAQDFPTPILVNNGIVYMNGNPKIRTFDAVTGAAVPSNLPNNLYGGLAMAIRGNTLYYGGYYDGIKHLGALDLTTGQPVPWNARVNRTVFSLHVVGDIVYVGGYLTSANDQPRTYAAAFDATTGDVLPFAPTISQAANQLLLVNTIFAQGDIAYIGGVFNMVNGTPASNLYATGSASVVVPAEPITNLNASNPLPNGTGFTLSWTPPSSGALGYTVVAIEGTNAPTGAPQNGETYTGNAAFTGAATG
jgi:hypothetical protein